MKLIMLGILACILVFYILGNSYLIVHTGAILALLAAIGLVVYFLIAVKPKN